MYSIEMWEALYVFCLLKLTEGLIINIWGWVELAVLAELEVNIWSYIHIWQLDKLCWLVVIKLKNKGLFIIFKVSRVSSVSRVRSQVFEKHINMVLREVLFWKLNWSHLINIWEWIELEVLAELVVKFCNSTYL